MIQNPSTFDAGVRSRRALRAFSTCLTFLFVAPLLAALIVLAWEASDIVGGVHTSTLVAWGQLPDGGVWQWARVVGYVPFLLYVAPAALFSAVQVYRRGVIGWRPLAAGVFCGLFVAVTVEIVFVAMTRLRYFMSWTDRAWNHVSMAIFAMVALLALLWWLNRRQQVATLLGGDNA